MPTATPLEIDLSADPILRFASATEDPQAFKQVVQSAVDRHPALGESEAYADEARYALYQQEAAMAPSVDFTFSGFQILGRDFQGTSIDNIVERTRADHRLDEMLSVNQLLTDFGATSQRVKAAGARLRAAGLDVDTAAEKVALNTIASWYDVFALRTILNITRAYLEDQRTSRDVIASRIKQGANAKVDAAMVENSIAQLELREANFQRQLAQAEARYRELTGSDAPKDLAPAPALGALPKSLETARISALANSASRSARIEAQAAENDAKAAKRDLLPTVGVAVDAGRYGLLERYRNYDVVGRLTLRQRFFGGLPQRAKAASAHAAAMDARSERIGEENARDAAIAFSDLEALNTQLTALKTSYAATLQTRDATMQRFRYSRGTLFDVLNASDTFYSAAIGYVQTLAQRDAARYVLLARTGGLLNALEIRTYDVRD